MEGKATITVVSAPPRGNYPYISNPHRGVLCLGAEMPGSI